jgi:hypothetical protein
MHPERNRAMGKIYHLWYVDVTARRRFQIWTMLLAFAYGIFNSIVLGRSEKELTWETLGLLCILTVGFTSYYCLGNRQTVASHFSFRKALFNRRTIVVGFATAAVMMLIVQTLTPAIDARVLAKRLSDAAISPENQKNQTEAKEILAEAQTKSIRLPSKVVQDAGERFIQAAKTAPSAWDVALQFSAYRSFLDARRNTAAFKQHPDDLSHYTITLHFFAQKGINCTSAATCALGFCDVRGPSDDSEGFRTEMLDQPKLESASPCRHLVTEIQPKLASTVAFQLDGSFLKNITIRNSVVKYDGGPVRLENVTFENCTFLFAQGEASQQLNQALLSSNTVNFVYPSSLR